MNNFLPVFTRHKMDNAILVYAAKAVLPWQSFQWQLISGCWYFLKKLALCAAILLWSGILLFAVQPVQADHTPLLLEQIQAAEPDTEDLREAQQQIEDLKAIKMRDDLTLGTFHKRSDDSIKSTELVYCNGCHASLPHSKSLRNRAFNNMHSLYIACETCHFRPEEKLLSYRWFDYPRNTAAENTSGRFYSGRKKEDKTLFIECDGSVKIAPFYQNRPALLTRDHDFSIKLQDQWKAADKKEKARIKATIHSPLQKQGPDCVACHTEQEDGMLDLTLLDATWEQKRKIQTNIIADFFKHYQPDEEVIDKADAEKEQRIRITDLLN